MTRILPLLLLALAGPARAGDAGAYLGPLVGYRHSFEQGAGGLAVGGVLGGWIGRFNAEIESTWSNDHTFSAVENRQFARNTTWANLGVTLVGGSRFRLALTAGPGMGWIKPAGKPIGPGEREPSVGAQETIRFDLTGRSRSAIGLFSFRLGAQQHWQADLVGKPDIGVVFGVAITMGVHGD